MRTKYWCFTLNNYTDEETAAINSLTNEPKVLYIIVGREVGASGTRHYQGYLELSTRLRLANVKQLPGLERAHFENRRGSAQQASDYCAKDGDILVQTGSLSRTTPGKRSDLEDLQNVLLPLGTFL
jgi:hypothetical protein